MSVDVRSIVAKLLVSTGTVGALVACKCPPDVPAGAEEDVPPSPELAAALQADLDAQRAEGCDATCNELAGDAVGVWSCAWEPTEAFSPDTLTCTSDGPDARVVVIDLGRQATDTGDPSDSDAPSPLAVFSLGQPECADVCRDTDGWQLALDAGYDDDTVPVVCPVFGTTTTDAFLSCQYAPPACRYGGRRPLASGGIEGVPGSGVGVWWATMARLEAASVPAFEELARDLAHHGAPAALVLRARLAADDERRHTRLCVERARAHGAEVVLPEIEASPIPDLRTLARHNAVEGCAREAFAALEAGFQAQHAADPADRAVLARIHDDEVRHGQLAWDVHAWVQDALCIDLQPVVAEAFVALAEQASTPEPDATATALGLPDPTTRRALVTGLAQELRAA